MEDQQKEPPVALEENGEDQKCSTMNLKSFDFLYETNLPVKNVHKKLQNLGIIKDCVYDPDMNIYKTTSKFGNNDKNKVGKEREISHLQKEEMTEENLMETVDLSDLMFSCNDFVLDDCTCFEQASQLVDPMLKDSESTPFSFSNSDSVQLFRFCLTEVSDDNFTTAAKCSDNFFNKNSERSKMTSAGDKLKKDHYNFYHVFELFDSNISKEPKMLNDESVKYNCTNINIKKIEENIKSPPIKKGRRYLPNFKEKVLEYTKSHTFKDTALHFKINCNTITEWSRESKTLSLQHNTCSMPGSDSNNYKTDIVVTPETKTEIILFNDVISFETDLNEPSLKYIEDELPSVDLMPDERFIKWIETKRLEKKELSRQEVFFSAKCCLGKVSKSFEKHSWFISWFKRFNKALKNLMKPKVETEKYIKYPANFKLEVALYAKIFTKNSAARVFNVPRKRIFDWFNSINPRKDSFHLYSQSQDAEAHTGKEKVMGNVKKDMTRSKIYSELHLWYEKRCLDGVRPASLEIKDKAREIFTSHGMNSIKFSDGWLNKFCRRMNIKLRHSEDDLLLLWVLTQLDNNVSLSHQEITDKSSSLIRCKKFKGSKGWTLRFLKRHRNLLQSSPSVEAQLPQIVEEKLNRFWGGFRENLISFQLQPGNIGCMDEVPLSFSFPEEGKSISLPLLRKTGFENCQGVAILCILGNGRILPPAVVFKGNGPKQVLSDRNIDILILYQEKGLITADVLETWFNHIWLSYTPTPNALVVDSFRPHCALEFRQLSARENCLLQVIPEGCSSRFQPLDVEVTPLFKEAIKTQWKEFSLRSSWKTMSSYRCPDQDMILRWVQAAYDKIKGCPLSIINSFKTTGLLE